MEDQELNDLALESVKVHLEEQGLTPNVVEGALLVGVGDLLCRCDVLQTPPGVHSSIVPVGIELVLGETGRSIREIIVGLSENRAEAVVQAAHTWAEGVFPPVRHLFEKMSEDDPRVYPFNMATQTLATGAVTDWDIHIGLPQAGGTQSQTLGESYSEGEIILLMINALTSAANDVRLHWIKVYLARQPDGRITVECKLDNDDWAEGVEALREFRWPKGKDFLQFRQFFVMIPSDKPNADVRQELTAFAQEFKEEPKKKSPRWWPFGR